MNRIRKKEGSLNLDKDKKVSTWNILVEGRAVKSLVYHDTTTTASFCNVFSKKE